METIDPLEPYYERKYVTKLQFIHRQTKSTEYKSQWDAIVGERKKRAVILPLKDQNDESIWFVITPQIRLMIEVLEKALTSDIQDIIKRMTDWDEKANELLVDEAFHSSVIEGAVSTRKRTTEMVNKSLEPVNVSEKMILNNYKTMLFILENMDDPITEDALIILHHMITDGTLDEEDKTLKYRNDDVSIKDLSLNRDIYIAPPFRKIQGMMDDLFAFIHQDTPEIHPIVKACIIHFYFAYVHPFFDGNGRTARVLTIWYLLKQGFAFFKYLSISTAIRSHKSSYYKAFEDVENNPTDVTYFIHNQVKLFFDRGAELIKELQIQIGKSLIEDWLKMQGIALSKRQLKEIMKFAKKDNNIITIEEYKRKHNVAYETARTDLAELYDLGIFDKVKKSRKFVYTFNFNEFCQKISKEVLEQQSSD